MVHPDDERCTRALDDHADAHAGIVNLPGFRAIVDALAGEGGHGPLKRATLRPAIARFGVSSKGKQSAGVGHHFVSPARPRGP